jgi:hypothetical protein
VSAREREQFSIVTAHADELTLDDLERRAGIGLPSSAPIRATLSGIRSWRHSASTRSSSPTPTTI